MPATISRLLMCFGVLIGTSIVYMLVLLSTDHWWRYETAWLAAGIVSCLVFAGGWTLVWRSAVRWSPRRLLQTLLALPFSLIPAGLAWTTGAHLMPNNDDTFGIFIGTLAWITTWLIGTAIVWRENAQERGERLRQLGIHAVACPDCGYNLTGLKEAKCPECGAAYTLDQLYASVAEQKAELGVE